MPEFEPRPLHLHTLDSLCADLVSGRAVSAGAEGALFALQDDRTRSALQWYRQSGAENWSAPVSGTHGEQLVDAIHAQPPIVPALPARPANASSRRLRLKKLEAHRFAGLHKFGTPSQAPANYIHEFLAPISLFEGTNGSGKTSLANAIIWALTGEILRPQREPEKGSEEFECWIAAADGSTERTNHRLTPVTPLPDPDAFRPEQDWIPADTWVELTFEDEAGVALAPIRRSQTRTARGKVVEAPPELGELGIDPIAIRIGTLMPSILPLIKVGSESELGRAVAQLTGLSALADLVDHVRRAKQKIDKDFVKAKVKDTENADASYERARTDLGKEIEANPGIAPPIAAPASSADETIEQALKDIKAHFESAKAVALSSAKSILGDAFKPDDPKLRNDLERNIAPALSADSGASRPPIPI